MLANANAGTDRSVHPEADVLLRGRRLLLSATLMETSGDVEICPESSQPGAGSPFFCSLTRYYLEQNWNGNFFRPEVVCVLGFIVVFM